jgi:hypothetical protein
VVGHQAVADERDRVSGDGVMQDLFANRVVKVVREDFFLSRTAITNVEESSRIESAYRSSHT